MNDKLTTLKIAYTELSWSEKQEVKEFIREFDAKGDLEKGRVNESLRKSLGPINSGECPLCGK